VYILFLIIVLILVIVHNELVLFVGSLSISMIYV